jgi:hypothetical protein
MTLGTIVPDGAKIAQVEQWERPCPDPLGGPDVYPDHLHFEVKDCESGLLVNPATVVAPYGATDPPTIVEWHLAHDDASYAPSDHWSVFPGPDVAGTCTAVVGNVDMLVRYETRHRPDLLPRNGDNLGARFVRWRACGGADPNCAWREAYDWATMNDHWATPNTYTEWAYSKRQTYDTKSSYVCGDDVFYAIPTNWMRESAGEPILPYAKGAWVTSAAELPTADELHVTSAVEVEDLAGMATTKTLPVCMGPRKFPKLLIRDCDADDGSEPSACAIFTDSPDILLEAAPSGSSTPTQAKVCMRNIGSGAIDAGSSVVIHAEATGTGAIAPCAALDATLSVPVATMKNRAGGWVGASDWGPGEERCATQPWPPSPGGLGKLACSRVIVAVRRKGDTPNTYPSVLFDNNRASKDGAAFHPADTSGLHRFDLRVPQRPGPGPFERIEVVFDRFAPTKRWWDPPRERPIPLGTEIHVGPGIRFRGVVGGSVVGVVSARRYASWNGRTPAKRPAVERSADPGAADGSWRIVTVPQGVDRVSLVDASAEKSGELRVFAWSGGPTQSEGIPGRIRVSLFANIGEGGRPVEIFQKVSTYRDARLHADALPRPGPG